MRFASELKEMKLLLVLAILTMVVCDGGGRVLAEMECYAIHSFIKQYSEILKQLPVYTFPVFSMCTNKTAELHYGDALLFYHNMTNAPECQKYLGRNRMNVYGKLYGEITDLWSTANCDACINAPNVTAEFMDLSNTLNKCLEENKANPCTSCDEDYQRVQQYYGQMQNRDRICFDIEDRMNQTRRAWSGIYNCCKDKKYSTVAFFSIASIACAIPVAFYVVMHVLRVRSDNRLTLLSATSVDEEPYHSNPSRNTASASQPNNHGRSGVVPEANETESDEDNGPIIDLANPSPSPSAAAALNNLNISEADLVNFLDSERGASKKSPEA
uniref:Uncharacterized protein n=1 Tax=Anopheles atroparvus TaxID=41427 RepID=A0A182JKR5_ANOAO